MFVRFIILIYLLYFSCFKALGTDLNSLFAAINHGLNFLQIGFLGTP